MEGNSKKEKIKAAIAISIVLVTIIVAVMIAIIYQIEGEKNIPFVQQKEYKHKKIQKKSGT